MNWMLDSGVARASNFNAVAKINIKLEKIEASTPEEKPCKLSLFFGWLLLTESIFYVNFYNTNIPKLK